MFQYTSENIINSNVGNIHGHRFEILDSVGAAVTSGTTGTTFIVDGVTNIRIADIKHIYRTPYAAASVATATITVPAIASNNYAAGDVIRLRIHLTEQGRSSSIMQNAYLHKNKPFTYEIIASGTPATDATAFVNAIKKDMAETDFNFFTASASGATITLTAKDEYLRFSTETGEVLPTGTVTSGIELFRIELEPTMPLTGAEDATSLAKGSVTNVGSQGAGTVNRLIKDLRIPTSATTDPFEVKDGGMPIPTGKYDQYLIEVETTRRHIAHGVMGEVNKTSLTSFVFFIESGILTDWNAVLALITSTNTSVSVTGTSTVTLAHAASQDDTYGTMTGGGNYRTGATATLTATPVGSHTFTSWSDGTTTYNTATITVTVSADKTYTATFA